MTQVLLIAASLATLVATAPAADLKSAAALLDDMKLPTNPKPQATDDSLAADAAALADTIASLPPEEAARRWLSLSDRQREVLNAPPQFRGNFVRPVAFSELFVAFPIAAQLPALKAALDQRPLDDAGGQRVALLKMLVASLRGDAAGVDASFADLRTAALARKTPPARIDERFEAFRKSLASRSDQKLKAVADFEREIDEAERPPAANEFRSHMSFSGWMQVPALVPLVGEAKARDLIGRALKLNRELSVDDDAATAKLARELALAALPTAKVPQWSLCQDIDAAELYEATVKRFPTPKDEDGDDDPSKLRNRGEARFYYLLALIAGDRGDDAMRVAKEIAADTSSERHSVYGGTREMLRRGYAGQVYEFTRRLAREQPDMPMWNMLVASAAQSGHADDVLQLARELAKQPGQDEGSQHMSNQHLADALLAADQVDEGIALLQDVLKTGDAPAKVTAHVRLATIGRLLARPGLVAESLDSATALMHAQDDRGGGTPSQALWAREMQLAGRDEQLVIALGEQIGEIGRHEHNTYGVPAQLTQLADAYFRADSPGDVITMLDRFPQWGEIDVATLQSGYGGAHDTTRPPAFFAAWALLETGRREEGLHILDFAIDRRPGFDPAYELLVKHHPDASAKLDELIARDAFEERPLIWKGVLLLQSGKLDEAEKTLKQAIAIDPSDGEEGKGDRMRVYAVLADVMEKRGNAKEAEFLRKVVKSIRLSEDADDVWGAGLLRRAISMYDESLSYFADAYCVQSRMAVHLASMGQDAEAEEHYRRAYELMPDSFGRVESHCFGCEQAFESSRAQTIAERVFKQLLAMSPTKPQLHYLLGYLRTIQGRHADAVPAFREAVRLDPAYLNAWIKLLECGKHAEMSTKDLDDAVITIVSLDPLGQHSAVSIEDVGDVARLYAALSTGAQRRPPTPTSLYPLRAVIAKRADDERGRGSIYRSPFSDVFDRRRGRPGKVIAEHPQVSPILEWMDEFGR